MLHALHGRRRRTSYHAVEPAVVRLVGRQLPLVHGAAAALAADPLLGRDVLGRQAVADRFGRKMERQPAPPIGVPSRSCTNDFQ